MLAAAVLDRCRPQRRQSLVMRAACARVSLHRTQGLEEFQRHPEYMCYLATLLCTPDVDRYQRQLAGITLKNFMRASQ